MTNLAQVIGNSVFAFRGYNTTNLGRSFELLTHPVYGEIVRSYLEEASEICSDQTGHGSNLVSRVQQQQETSLDSYHEAIALIAAMELAQIEILEKIFQVRYVDAKFSMGYSLGEIVALSAGGVITLRDALQIPLAMARDSVRLAHDVTLGVVFSLGPVLDLVSVRRLCTEINQEGVGVIGISAHLSPNTILIMGQNDTVTEFGRRMYDVLPQKVHLRKNQHRWPPLHSPIVWQHCIPNRAACMMHALPMAMRPPVPPVFSLATGQSNYDDTNTREILHRWVDHPQRLWDGLYEVLSSGAEYVIHVGPEPNLIPATFRRISDNVQAQLNTRSIGGLGLRAISRAVRRPWLARLLPSRSALLRAPQVKQIILEDWLLQQKL